MVMMMRDDDDEDDDYYKNLRFSLLLVSLFLRARLECRGRRRSSATVHTDECEAVDVIIINRVPVCEHPILRTSVSRDLCDPLLHLFSLIIIQQPPERLQRLQLTKRRFPVTP